MLKIFDNNIAGKRKSHLMLSPEKYTAMTTVYLEEPEDVTNHTHEAITKVGLEVMVIKDNHSATFLLSSEQVKDLKEYLNAYF